MTELDVPDHPTAADLGDIQGLVYRGYARHPYAGFLLAQLHDTGPARAWLAEVRRQVTPASATHVATPVQVALSYTGLTALGVPDEVLFGLPQEIKLGMVGRATVLDDEPARWTLGGYDQRLDVLVMIYAHDERAREHAIAHHRKLLETAGAKIHAEELSWRFAEHEHFGFADGLSQPFLRGLHQRELPGQAEVAAGEVVLGYRNAYGKAPQTPKQGNLDLGKNGTYLVFRKLDQDVVRFWTWLAARAHELAPDDPAVIDQLAAKLIGRWRSGAPLVRAPDRDDPDQARAEVRNDFTFLPHDAEGKRCPLSAHVRRANPRDAHGGSIDDSLTVVQRHRILRRGRSYGAPLPVGDAIAGNDDRQSRGLYFISLQTSIARGFEFIQQTWLANPGFLGMHREPDPLLGSSAGTCHFTIPADPCRLRLTSIPTVVTPLGGGYFFLPSLTALSRIAAGR